MTQHAGSKETQSNGKAPNNLRDLRQNALIGNGIGFAKESNQQLNTGRSSEGTASRITIEQCGQFDVSRE